MVRFTDEPSDPAEALASVTFLPFVTPAEAEAATLAADELRQSDIERAVVRALARKDLSEWEVTRILVDNDVESSDFEAYLERYRASGYVDDYAYAERQVEILHRRKGFGRSQISRELSAKKVSNEIISDVLSSLDDGDELARAVALAEKRAPSLQRLDRETGERRLTSFLQRKGYPSAIIRQAVAVALPRTQGASTVRFR